MTDMPERIRVSPTHRPSNPHDLWVHEPPYHGRGTEYVRADLLDAANARIAELEAMLTDDLTAPYLAGLARGRAEMKEEAAKVADDHLPKDMWEARDSTAEYNAACRHIAAAIRALP